MQWTGLALASPLGRLLGYAPAYISEYEPERMDIAA
jgi:hypothetical protein